MEAIRAANFLLNQDAGGAAWIAFNRDPDAALAGARGRRGAGGRAQRSSQG
jgi:5-methyltetrahydrofolate--homocysteine methyltransferase